MTEIRDGDALDVRLPGGAVAVDVGPPVMGPPGMRGQTGPRGDPGGTTVIVFAFGFERTPDELPETGLIPSGWDGVRRPDTPIQVAVGQSVEHVADGYLWLFVGPSSVPGGWIETGQMRGPPGDRGPIGDAGPAGPAGERGLPGPTGSPGAPGSAGPSGPQGARGEIGQTGPAGATGPRGETGERGTDGRDGIDGEPGPAGERGERGETGETGQPGAPSFIVGHLSTKTAAELAAIAPTGLIPAHFDGPSRPPVAYQMQVGEAYAAQAPNEQPFLLGQAIVWCGLGTMSNGWIAVVIRGETGERGERGETGELGPVGPVGPAGAAGLDGSRWHWSPFAPPSSETIGPHAPGDFVLCLIPGGTGTTPGHGDVYHATSVGVFAYDGNIRGPAGPTGPQGPPGEVSAAELAALATRVDSLQLRIDRLESFAVQTMTSDRRLTDGEDTILISVPLTAGDWMASAVCTLELDLAVPSATNRNVTAWIDGVGPVVITGPRSSQLSLHQALPLGQLSLGPIRIVASGPGNAVIHVRADTVGAGPYTGQVIVKGSTSTAPIIAGATGAVAR